MKKKTLLLLGSACLYAGGFHAFAQTESINALERGVALMDDQAKLREAVAAFQTVIESDRESKALAAEARYHLAKCYLRLGEKKKAQEQVAALLADETTPAEWVALATQIVPPSSPFEAIPWGDSELQTYEVLLPNGIVYGTSFMTVRKAQRDGRATWVAGITRDGGGLMQTGSEFDAETLRPISARAASISFGDIAIAFDPDGSWATRQVGSEIELSTGKASAELLLENEQSAQLIRALPDKLGEEYHLKVATGIFGGGVIDFVLTAAAHEEIKVKAGTFDCVRFDTNIGQTFWVQRGGNRHVVRMSLAGASLDLVSVTQPWDHTAGTTLTSKGLGSTITLPANAFHAVRADKDDIWRMQVADGDFRFLSTMVEIQPTTNFVEKARESADALWLTILDNLEKDAREIVDDSLSVTPLEIDGRKAVIGSATVRSGQLTQRLHTLTAVGEKYSLVLTTTTQLGSDEVAKELLIQMFTSWTE